MGSAEAPPGPGSRGNGKKDQVKGKKDAKKGWTAPAIIKEKKRDRFRKKGLVQNDVPPR